MVRYKTVDYKYMAWLCRMAVIKVGKDMRLHDVVDDLCRHTGLNLDDRVIMHHLGDRVYERRTLDERGVMRVTTMIRGT